MLREVNKQDKNRIKYLKELSQLESVHFVARDLDGKLWGYYISPRKYLGEDDEDRDGDYKDGEDIRYGEWKANSPHDIIRLKENTKKGSFPEIKWTDAFPLEISWLVKKYEERYGEV